MLLVIAPAKTQKKAELPAACRQFSSPHFINKSKQLINELKAFSEPQLAKMMKTSARLTAATYRQIHNFTTPFHKENAHPALYTFQGDAYAMIDTAGYSDTQLAYAQKHLVILSGLYGMLRPLDLMQPYRLEMGLKFAPAGMKNLYQFWQQEITARIVQQLAAAAEKTVINLASDEYAKVLDKKVLQQNGCDIITITFQQPHTKGTGGYRTIPIHSKRARGMMVDFIIKNRLTKAEQLKVFSEGDYLFNPEKSTEKSWVFHQMSKVPGNITKATAPALST